MKISIMWMTRKRSHELIYSFASFVNKADDNKNIEYFFVLDPDDTVTMEALQKVQFMAIAHEVVIQVIIMNKRYGYAELEQYQNAVGKVFTGECLFILNDDLLCLSQGWDTSLRNVLKNHINEPKWIGMAPINEQNKSIITFVGINRKWYEITGRVSGTRAADGYLKIVGNKSGISPIIFDIDLIHLQRGRQRIGYKTKSGEQKIVSGLPDDGAGGYHTKNKIPPKYEFDRGIGKDRIEQDVANLKKWRNANEKILADTC